MEVPAMRDMVRGLRVFPAELPQFDVRSVPGDPVTLFLTWFAEAVRDKILGPQAMTLSTADAVGRVSSRVLLCRDVDEAGRWYFESNAASGKGRDLAANPRAAASFYWPQHGRQIRITGAAASAGREASAADFRAKPPAARAAGLAGHQSEPLGDLADLDEALRRAQADVDANPDLVDPDSTFYALTADTVEFWQGDPRRRHRRLRYQRAADAWTSGLLWP
jgi:pyridoxamine 5'-phosphate oxidase